MTPTIETVNRLAGAWAELVWAVAWQSAILVGLFAVVASRLRSSSPGLRYWFWQIAAIKLLVMSATIDGARVALSGAAVTVRPPVRTAV